MTKTRSTSRVLHAAVEIKSWLGRTPSAAEVRPAACVACKAPSCPIGGPIQLVGHGLRQRQVLGPVEVGGVPAALVVLVRRYLCRVCGAVMTVVPRGVVPGRVYGALAIVVALALWAIQGLASAGIRARVSPWPHVADPRQWAMPARWVDAVARGGLLAGVVRPSPASWTRQQVAARIATSAVAAGLAPVSVLDTG